MERIRPRFDVLSLVAVATMVAVTLVVTITADHDLLDVAASLLFAIPFIALTTAPVWIGSWFGRMSDRPWWIGQVVGLVVLLVSLGAFREDASATLFLLWTYVGILAAIAATIAYVISWAFSRRAQRSDERAELGD